MDLLGDFSQVLVELASSLLDEEELEDGFHPDADRGWKRVIEAERRGAKEERMSAVNLIDFEMIKSGSEPLARIREKLLSRGR